MAPRNHLCTTIPSYISKVSSKATGKAQLFFAVSAPPIELMRGAGRGIKFEASLSRDKDSLVGFGFIDSTKILERYLTRAEITIENVYTSMQK